MLDGEKEVAVIQYEKLFKYIKEIQLDKYYKVQIYFQKLTLVCGFGLKNHFWSNLYTIYGYNLITLTSNYGIHVTVKIDKPLVRLKVVCRLSVDKGQVLRSGILDTSFSRCVLPLKDGLTQKLK